MSALYDIILDDLIRNIDRCINLKITAKQALAVMDFKASRDRYTKFSGLTVEENRRSYLNCFDKAFRSNYTNDSNEPEPIGSDW